MGQLERRHNNAPLLAGDPNPAGKVHAWAEGTACEERGLHYVLFCSGTDIQHHHNSLCGEAPDQLSQAGCVEGCLHQGGRLTVPRLRASKARQPRPINSRAVPCMPRTVSLMMM